MEAAGRPRARPPRGKLLRGRRPGPAGGQPPRYPHSLTRAGARRAPRAPEPADPDAGAPARRRPAFQGQCAQLLLHVRAAEPRAAPPVGALRGAGCHVPGVRRGPGGRPRLGARALPGRGQALLTPGLRTPGRPGGLPVTP